jgi:hypothetical protein
MLAVNMRSSSIRALVLVVVLAGAPFARAADEANPAAAKDSGSTLEGDITGGGTEPGAAVLVTAIQLETSKSFVTATTTPGHFRITGLPHGYYELAFATGDKLHVGSVPVVVAPGARLKMKVNLIDTPPYSESGDPVLIPVLDQPANAVAEVRGNYEKPWYKKNVGKATIIGGSVLMLLLLTN